METQPEILNSGRLIIVAYRLPVSIIHDTDGTRHQQNAGGLVSAILSMASEQKLPILAAGRKIQWVGFSDNSAEEWEHWPFKNQLFEVHPVFIPPEINEDYYEGFCNNMLWPICHYFPSLAHFDDNYYEAYQRANQMFFDKVAEIIRPNDIVWIQDYQLMLLPELIRKKFHHNQIGFFFHIPFPSYEIFRMIPTQWRKALIDGMLGADVIGFHTNDYVEYFLKSARLVSGYNNSLHYIQTNDRIIKVDSFPISIDFDKFNDSFDVPEIVEARQETLASLSGRIIFSVDRLDYSKGIIHRLQGFLRFLERYPQWHEKVTFVMTVVPSRDTIDQYQNMKVEIDQTVGAINAKFGTIFWQPVLYHYRSLDFNDLIHMYTACDIALITPVRDGMNLVSKEFIASRKDSKGVLILSEMAGAAAELGEALIINPLDTQNIADAIYTALTMPEQEQSTRMEAMRERIRTYDVFEWTKDFFMTLTSLKQDFSRLNRVFLNQTNMDEIKHRYQYTSRRILFFDYDGTLAPIVTDPSKAIISSDVALLIQSLSLENTVVIISGRNRYFLEQVFSNLSVHLVAEHGAWVRKSDNAEWILNEAYEDNWKDNIRTILNLYTERCPGAFMEEKETSLAWHYRTAENPEFAIRRAQELTWQLKNYIQPELNLQIIDGDMVIEVKKSAFNKGTSARQFIEEEMYDFILAIGDDTTDEDMFEALPSSAYTIKIGDGLSAARYHIKSQSEVINFLSYISEIAVL